jgi:1-hydroxycarotenoid 3,4-desaturase
MRLLYTTVRLGVVKNTKHVIVVGAGVGGLASAADLARRGFRVTVLERALTPGGKMRQVEVGGRGVDGGPTVFTMRWAFEGLFADAGQRLDDFLTLAPIEVLARHAWRTGGRLDLFADVERSAQAIEAFATKADAEGYRAFCERSAQVYRALAPHFIATERATPVSLVTRLGPAGLPAMFRAAPWRSLWSSLGDTFRDPRLRQLFARYATYVGSSPFLTPATLMLVAHVEQDGLWRAVGGMHQVAVALQRLGERQGATYRFGAHVESVTTANGRVSGVQLRGGERLEADAVVFNGDVSALASGVVAGAGGATKVTPRADRSLSAVTWCLNSRTSGFPLLHHNVFFAEDYTDEFDAIFTRRTVTAHPTVYVCAQDRGGGEAPEGPERLLVLVNAPPDGDERALEVDALRERTFAVLSACGLQVAPGAEVVTTPVEFEALFPSTGGALYGRSNHGVLGTFARAGNTTALPGLYAAGGSVHPGPGIPMAVLSGRLCAARLEQDLAGGRGRVSVAVP